MCQLLAIQVAEFPCGEQIMQLLSHAPERFSNPGSRMRNLAPIQHRNRFRGEMGDTHRQGRQRGPVGAKLLHGTVDRKSVVSGKRVSVRVALGGRRVIKTTILYLYIDYTKK